MSEQQSVMGDFLSQSDRRAGGKRGLSWINEDGTGRIDVWLSQHFRPLKVWGRWVPRVGTLKDPETGAEKPKIFKQSTLSLEDEVTNDKQYFRSRLTGNREYAPQHDPIDMMIELVRKLVMSGKVGFAAPVFRWSTPSEEKTVRAAGLWGYGKNLTEGQKLEMSKAGVSLMNAWQEGLLSKASWVFAVVDEAHAEEGVQPVTVKPALGNHVKAVIFKEIKNCNPSLTNAEIEDAVKRNVRLQGDPCFTPYAIRWEKYNDRSLPFDKQYEATKMDRIVLRPEVARLIDSASAVPDVSRYTERPNLLALRNNLESHCLIKLDWEAIFAPAMAWYTQNGWDPGGQERNPEDGSEDDGEGGIGASAPSNTPQGTLGPSEVRVAPAAPPPFTPAAQASKEVLYDCDGCGAPEILRASDLNCPKCGYSYGPKEPAPLPAPRRKRSEVAGAAPAVAVQDSRPSSVASATAPIPPPPPPLPIEIEKDDHIPWE